MVYVLQRFVTLLFFLSVCWQTEDNGLSLLSQNMVWIGHISVSLRFKKWIKTFYKYVCVSSRSLFVYVFTEKVDVTYLSFFLIQNDKKVFLLDLRFLDSVLFSLQENTFHLCTFGCVALDMKLSCLLFLLMFLHLDLSPPVVNSVDWTWFGKSTNACRSKK